VDLSGTINPHGGNTTYRFEYGPTSKYGHSTKPVQIKGGWEAVQVSAEVPYTAESQEGYTCHPEFHYRLVATNQEGSRMGIDKTAVLSLIIGS
jgi:hypothetical protein